MLQRLNEEFSLIKSVFDGAQIDKDQKWILIPNYRIKEVEGWNKESMDICIEVRNGFPGAAPYGIYVPVDLRFKGENPDNWVCPAKHQPSFDGQWALISWTPKNGWNPGTDISKGSNLLGFVLSFSDRFKEGK